MRRTSASGGRITPFRQPTKRPSCPTRAVAFETLETRCLLSADAGSVLFSDVASETFEAPLAEVLVEAAPAAPIIDLGDTRRLSTFAPEPRRELLVIDASVADRESLAAALLADAGDDRNFDVLLLDATGDGLGQIHADLARHNAVFDALHIVTHGSAHGMTLGSSALGPSNPIEHANLLTAWGVFLAEEADLLFYACDLAGTQAGRDWLQSVAELTGADVAASVDLTGDGALGGDWELEFRTGTIESLLGLDSGSSLPWRHVLSGDAIANVPSNTAIAVDGNGNFVIVWQTPHPDDNAWDVYGQRYDAAGAPIAAQFLIAQTISGDQYEPDIVMRSSGDFVVVWTGRGQEGDGAGEGNIYARRFGADATPLGAEFRVNAWTAGDQHSPAIGLSDSSGNFVVAWTSVGQDGSGAGIYARKYDSTGAALTDEFQINSTTAGDQSSPDVAADSFDDFVFVWQSQDQDGSGWGIYRTYYALNGRFEGGEKRVNTYTLGDQTDPVVAFNSNGNWLIAWTSDGQDGTGTEIHADFFRYSGNGGTSTGEFQVNDGTSGNQYDPAIAVDSASNFVITWTTLAPEGAVSIESSIHAQLLVRQGPGVKLHGSEVLINADQNGDQRNAAVAMASDGSYIVAWDGGAGDAMGVHLRQYANPFDASAPAINLANASLLYLENDPALFLDPGLTLSDADSAQLTGATVSFDAGYAAGQDVLAMVDQFGITGSFADATGVLTLTGTASMSAYQAALRSVSYRNTSDAPNTLPRRITVTVTDGILAGSDSRYINVQAVNDAPVLSGANDLLPILEDAAGNGGTLVSALVGGWVSDPDSDAVGGIAVIGADDSHGTWQYSLDGGGAWSAFGSPSAAGARLLLADASTYVRFVPQANWNGVVAGGLSFRAWDASSGTAGGIADTTLNGGTSAFSTATASAGITVGAVNDAPAGADRTLGLLEDTSHVFAIADFGFSDPHDTPVHALGAVRIVSLPLSGSLKNNGIAVSASQYVTRADIEAGRLVYTPGLNGNGAGYASFTFQVRDDGGTADGGVDFDATPNTITFDVAAVNDAPINTMPTIQHTAYGTSLVFSQANGNPIFVSDVDAGASQIQVDLVATHGLLSLSGTAGLTFLAGTGTVDIAMSFRGTVSAVNVALNGLVFAPDLFFDGTATITLTSSDLGAAGSGGTRTDSDVVSVLVAPANAIVANADGYSIGAGALLNAASVLTNDVDPGLGTLSLASINGNAAAIGAPVVLASGAVLTAASDGTFTYDPNGVYAGLPAGGDALDSFEYSVSSTSGRSGSGTVTIAIVGVNDAPVLSGANGLLPILEDAADNGGTVVSALVGGWVSDPDSDAVGGIAVIGVDDSHGTWQYSLDGGGAWSAFGSPSAAGARLLLADASTYVRFVPQANWNGVVAGGLSFRAWDASSGTAGGIADTTLNGGTSAFSTATASAGITVGAVNDAPAGADRTLGLLEDTSHVFAIADFGFSDPHDTPVHALGAVRIVSLPLSGSLKNNGIAVSASQYVTRADIEAGRLVYTPGLNGNGAGYASFTFQVRDDGGTADGGVDFDATPNTITFDVAAVNDAPVLSNLGGAIGVGAEDSEIVVSFAGLLAQSGATDIDGTITGFVVKSVQSGSLRIGASGATAAPFAAGSNDIIDTLRSAYWTPAANAWGTLDALALVARDDGGLESATQQAIALVWAVADAPRVSNATTLEDVPTGADLRLLPSLGDGTEVTHFKVQSISGGTLYLSDGATRLHDGDFITVAQGAAGLVFQPLADSVVDGRFEVAAATAPTNAALGPDVAVVTVAVVPVNDAPVLSGIADLPLLVADGRNDGASVADLLAGFVSDVDAGSAFGIALVAADDLNGFWQYTLDAGLTWAAIGAVGHADALLLAADAGARIRFVPNADFTGRASIDVRAWDRTSGNAGGRGDASTGGGSTAFSAVVAKARVEVVAGTAPVPVADEAPPALAPPVPEAVEMADMTNNSANTAATDIEVMTVAPALPDKEQSVASDKDTPSSATNVPSAASSEEPSPVSPGILSGTSDVPGPTVPRFDDAPVARLPGPALYDSGVAAVQTLLVQNVSAPSVAGTPPVAAVVLGADFVAQPDRTAEAVGGKDLREAFDDVREQVASESALEARVAAASVALGGSLSAGYVMWLVRGGVLVTSLMSSLPAWRVIDPLPVLSHRARRDIDDDDDDDDQSIESMVDDDTEQKRKAEMAHRTDSDSDPYRALAASADAIDRRLP